MKQDFTSLYGKLGPEGEEVQRVWVVIWDRELGCGRGYSARCKHWLGGAYLGGSQPKAHLVQGKLSVCHSSKLLKTAGCSHYMVCAIQQGQQ